MMMILGMGVSVAKEKKKKNKSMRETTVMESPPNPSPPPPKKTLRSVLFLSPSFAVPLRYPGLFFFFFSLSQVQQGALQGASSSFSSSSRPACLKLVWCCAVLCYFVKRVVMPYSMIAHNAMPPPPTTFLSVSARRPFIVVHATHTTDLLSIKIVQEESHHKSHKA